MTVSKDEVSEGRRNLPGLVKEPDEGATPLPALIKKRYESAANMKAATEKTDTIVGDSKKNTDDRMKREYKEGTNVKREKGRKGLLFCPPPFLPSELKKEHA